MIPLRQSTASQTIQLGGIFVDSSDGDTEETALTIANTDIKLHKFGATSLANKNSGGGTHMSNGRYYATFDATDSNTVGPLTITVHISGALVETIHCYVFEEAIYDALYASGATGELPAMLSKMLKYFQLLFRKDAAIATDNATELTAVNADGGSGAGAFDNTTESTEALKDLIPAAVWSASGRTLSDPAGFKKNTAADLTFVLRSSTDGRTPIAGETVTAQRSIDGAAFAACANSAVEIGNGAYIITLAAADLNGDIIILRLTSSGSDDLLITIKTET